MSESTVSELDNFLGKIFSPSGTDQLGAHLEAVKEYVRSWATVNIKPLIQPEQISATSLREAASRAAAEAQSLREMLSSYSPTNSVEENYKKVAEIVAETKESNVARLNQLADNADVRALSNAERFATALHLAKELGAVAGLFDIALKGTDAISGAGTWDQVGETSLGVLAGFGAGLAIGVAVSGIPVLAALTIAIAGGYVASKAAEALIWPLLREASTHIPSEFWDGIFGAIESIGGAVNTFFNSARAVILQRDPLVLDLDGDGLELSAASANVLFDHNADGIKTGTGWARPDDGFLVRDLNGNGSIDSGRELFGVDTEKSNGQLATQGFDALADLDANGDGQITSADAAWGQLQVWRDVNQDGISQAGELSTLDALGITRIGLNGSSSGPQAGQTINNNRVALSTTFTRNGVDRTVGAIDLEANGFFSEIPPEVVDEEGNPVVISEAASALPQMNGSGMVRNLRAAMSLGGTQADELEAAVAAFSAATTRDEQLALIDNLITEWAQTSSYWSSLEGYLGGSVTLTPPAGMTAEEYRNMIAVLEAFNGSRFYAPLGSAMPAGQWGGTVNGVMGYSVTPVAAQVQLLQQAYDALKESVYEALVVQTRLKPYLDAVELTVDESGVHVDASGVGVLALQAAQTNASKAITDLVDLRHYFHDALDGMGWSFGAALAPVLYSVEMTPELSALLVTEKIVRMGAEQTALVVSAGQAGFSVIGNALDNSIAGNANGVEYLYGGEGNDTLTSMGQGDLLDGGAGDDTLIAGGLYTTLVGGAGNDVLKSSSANLYHMKWKGGAGNDTIMGTSYADYYYFNRGDGADLIIDSGQHSMTNASYMDRLVFGPGINASDLGARRVGNDLVLTVAGVAGDQITIQNMFDNASGNSRIELVVFADGSSWSHEQLAQLALNTTNASTSGDDTISGIAAYSELISGGEGNDILTSVGSNDVLDGGVGDDTLIAGGQYTTLLGGAGNDVLRSSSSNLYHMTWEGGTGNDAITGTSYADYYRFSRGDGADLISDNGTHNMANASYVDQLRFGEGISASDLGARRVGNDLVLTVAGAEGDQLTIQNWFADTSGTYRVEQLLFADGSTWSHEQLAQLALDTSNAGTSGNDTLSGTAAYSELISGGDGNDTLTSAGSGDVLEGGAGGDTLIAGGLYTTLRGGAGNDVLRSSSSSLYHMTWEGGTGDDTITGTSYADYYRFNRGDGADIITDSGSHYPSNPSYADEVRFGPGINASDLGARRVGDDLVLTVAGAVGDQITVRYWFANSAYRIEKLTFDDGSSWSHEQLAQLALTTANTGTADADNMAGTQDYVDHLLGGEGNDTLTAVGSGDTLDGGAGDDVLRLNTYSTGGTVFIGGTGNDMLSGGAYNDTYVFNRGDGSDTISENTNGYNYGHTDVLRFGQGILESDIGAQRVGVDLLVTVAGQQGDQITIKNWFYDVAGGYRMERLEFASGATWDHAALTQLALTTTNTGTAGADSLAGTQHYVDHLLGGEGNDTLTAVGSGDTLDGGAGDDVLRLNTYSTGGTVLIGGTGNDMLSGGAYNDTYVFNRGDGSDTISENTNGYNYGHTDVLRFGQGILESDIGAQRVGVDLLVTVAGQQGDQITIKNWFYDVAGGYRMERLEFASGATWDHAALTQLALTTTNTGTAGADSLTGTQHYVDHLLGGEGDDTLTSVGSGDVLDGGAGNDTLIAGGLYTSLRGGAGNDVLRSSSSSQYHMTWEGGTGNDTITGTGYADYYRFNRGDGADLISDTGSHSPTNPSYADRLTFGEGIGEEELWFSRSGNDLLVQVLGDGGQVQIKDWYASSSYLVEEMHLSDGQKLLFNQVDALVNAMAAFAPPAPGQTTLTPEQQTALAPVIAAAWN